MRLLLIADNFPSPLEPTRGIFNLGLARALAARHDVRVVAPVSWLRGRSPRMATIEGIEVHHPRYYYTPKVLRRFYGSFLWWSVRGTVLRLLREQRPDAVLGYWAHPDGAVAVRAARLAGVPAVVMVGGSDVLLLARNRVRRRCIGRVLRQADAVVTTSQDLKQKLGDLGVSPERVHVVYRGVDHQRFSPGDRAGARQRLGIPTEGRSLLAVGRLVPVKGFDVLLEACARLRDRGTVFHLYLVGDGPLREKLRAQCDALGLSGTVTLAGLVRHEELADWYRAADLTVLPSRSEGVPNVLRESLACSTPFVASDVGGVAELAAAGGGRLVPPEDPVILADAIAAALAAPARPVISPTAGWEESAEALLRVLRPLTLQPLSPLAA
jgi:glycosyltransferase involved in cell wall biosynthesis